MGKLVLITAIFVVVTVAAAFGIPWIVQANGTEFCGLGTDDVDPECFGPVDWNVAWLVVILVGLAAAAATFALQRLSDRLRERRGSTAG
jgi:hypothetical protein